MKTITIYFFNEDVYGNEYGSHILEFKTDITDKEKLYEYINLTYRQLLEVYNYYSLIES